MLRESLLDEIRSLPPEDRRQLIKLIENTFNEASPERTDSILDYRGIGAHLRDDTVDAQDYVNQLRSEWDDRP